MSTPEPAEAVAEFARRAAVLSAQVRATQAGVARIQSEALSLASDVRQYALEVERSGALPSESRDEFLGHLKALEASITALASVRL